MRMIPVIEVDEELYDYYSHLRCEFGALVRVRTGACPSDYAGTEINDLHRRLFYPGLDDPERYPGIYPRPVFFLHLGESIKDDERKGAFGKVRVQHPMLR